LGTTLEALQSNEDLGKIALESLTELSKSHAIFWKGFDDKLVFLVSEIIKNKSFEDGTRSQAAEIVLTLAKEVPATLRKMP
jgi:hypothetical protein